MERRTREGEYILKNEKNDMWNTRLFLEFFSLDN